MHLMQELPSTAVRLVHIQHGDSRPYGCAQRSEVLAGIESDVLETFLAQLALVDDVPNGITEKLATLLAADRLPKADQLAALYTEASGESLL